MAEIDLQGMEQLLAKLEEMGKQGTKIANEAVKKAGEYEAEQMEAEAPKKTGEMANSIEVSKVKTKNGTKYVEVAPDKQHFYYKFVELGTKDMPANPFMSRTFNKTKKELKEIMKEELKKGLGL